MKELLIFHDQATQMQAPMSDGVLDGVVNIEQHGRKLAQMQYVQGKLHGWLLTYHPNGQIAARMPYQQGILHGKAEYFSLEGTLQCWEHWQHGQRHGESRTLFADGGTQEIAHWQHDLRQQLVEQFYPNGNVALRQQYQQGKVVGDIERYAADGRILATDGTPRSRWRSWLEKI